MRRVMGGLLILLAMAGLSACTGGGSPGPSPTSSPSGASSTVPDDYVGVTVEFESDALSRTDIRTTRLSKDAYLVGPTYGVGFDRVAVTRELTGAQRQAMGMQNAADPDHILSIGDDQPIRASAGHEFVLAQMTKANKWLPAICCEARWSAAVVVAGTPHPVEHLLLGDSVIVVVAPIGAPVSLAMTDAGRTQSIDLRTGHRGRDAIAAYYPILSAGTGFRELIHVNGIDPANTYLPFDLTVDLERQPYLEDKGWAANGRDWVTVRVSTLLINDATLKLNIAKSLTVRADGRIIPLPAATVVTDSMSSGTGMADTKLAVQVPDSVRQFSITYTTVGTFTKPGSSTVHSFSRIPGKNRSTVTLQAS